jgi:hypothetical protein
MSFPKPLIASALVLGTLLCSTALHAQVGVSGVADDTATVEEAAPPALGEPPVAVAEAPVEGAGGPPPLPAEVTPPPLPTLPDYYVGLDGAPVGPLDEAALRDLAAKGDLTADTLIWTEGMADWVKAGEVTEVAALLEAEPEPETKKLGVAGDEAKGAKPAPAPAPSPGVAGGADYLLGAWYVDGVINMPDMGQVDADMTQIFNPDGSYSASGSVITAVPGLGSTPYEVLVEVTGTWTAKERPDGSIELTVTSTTVISIPSIGYAPTATSNVETAVLQVIDGDSFIDGEGIEWARD